MDKFRSLFPFYKDDADYTTNAPSYYDDLARKQKLIKMLAERIWEYDKILADSLEEVEEVLRQVIDKIGEGFNQEIYDLLVQWVEDGTLDHIINETLMNLKADKTELASLETDLTNQIDSLNITLTDQINTFITSINNSITEFKELVNQDISAFKEETNTLISINKQETTNQLTELNKNISDNHFYLTDKTKLQQAIYEAENGVLYLKKQTYLINTPLKINSNTTIIGNGATFKRDANIDNMIINNSNGVDGGYDANKNITLNNIYFDASGGSFSDRCTMVAFGHSKNIKILNSTFKKLRNWHMIELNAVKNAVIENCHFEDYGTSTMGTEMVQIDIAQGAHTFPWFGPYDNTTCDNIQIINNTFLNGITAIGTHTASPNKEHTRISILNNSIINMSKTAITGLDWAFTKINKNHFSNVFRGIHLRTQGREVNNHIIQDNYMLGKPDNTDSRAIIIGGIKDGYGVNGGSIIGNRVKGFGSHGIGVDYSKRWVVEGNDVTNSGRNGIIIYGSINVAVVNNICLSNNVSGHSLDKDITVQNMSKYVNVSNNNIQTLSVLARNENGLVTNNLIQNEMILEGTSNKGINNVVNGVIVN